jgi:hypothetical protein
LIYQLRRISLPHYTFTIQKDLNLQAWEWAASVFLGTTSFRGSQVNDRFVYYVGNTDHSLVILTDNSGNEGCLHSLRFASTSKCLQREAGRDAERRHKELRAFGLPASHVTCGIKREPQNSRGLAV